MFALMMLYSLSFGFACAAQGPTNGALGKHVGSMEATLVSFTGGTLGMVVLNVISFAVTGQSALAGVFDCEPWMLLGGFYGAFGVFVFAYCVPRLGVALTMTLQLLSGTILSFAVDAFGWFASPIIPLSAYRLVGCGFLLVGILLIYKARLVQAQQEGASAETNGKPLVLVLLSLASGITVGFMPATNVALRAHTGLFEAGLIHFAIGTAAILVITLIAYKGRLKSLRGIAPWKLVGGLYGVYGIPALILTTPVLGVGLNTATNQLGQLIGAVIVDTFGLFQSPKVQVNKWRVAGIAVLLVGIVVIALSKIL